MTATDGMGSEKIGENHGPWEFKHGVYRKSN